LPIPNQRVFLVVLPKKKLHLLQIAMITIDFVIVRLGGDDQLFPYMSSTYIPPG
jgi:hypothetical protein